jgi:glucose/arabinose dehydrogenase
MGHSMSRTIRFGLLAALAAGAASAAMCQDEQPLRTGADALGDWSKDAPGVRRKITPADLPPPFTTPSVAANSAVVARPQGAQPQVPAGFKVEAFATDLQNPRTIRIAPNGDVFVAELYPGKIILLRSDPGAGQASTKTVFTEGLTQPFGIAFYPPGPNPQWVYVAETNRVVRFPYQNGDDKARGPAEVIVPQLTEHGGGHNTRDIVFSPDGQRMFVSVGSGSNVADGMEPKPLEDAIAFDKEHGLGATWGSELDRADVLVFDPQGKGRRVFASGIRNCSGLGVEPHTGDIWCATNERDLLGDNLVPDYATRVQEGHFYGWPWWYIGDNEDPRANVKGARPDLKGQVTIPDVLFQSHSAPLGISFYPDTPSGPAAFPLTFRGDAFVALHGSWNRSLRTGYKVVRLRLKDGVPTGEYDDFMTGFVVDAASVWGRPVDTAIAKDGALLVTDDGGNVIWRISPAN